MEPLHEFPDTFTFFTRWFIPRKPMWLRLGDFARIGWHTDRWDTDYLIRRAGAQHVRVQRRKDPAGAYKLDNSEYAHMPFQEFLAQTFAHPDGNDNLYLNLQENEVMSPPLLQLVGDFRLPDFYCELPLRCMNLWMGKSRDGITTPLHHDFDDNVYAVVRGTKRFRLFPPECAPDLYPRGILAQVRSNGLIDYRDRATAYMPHVAQVDPDDPDHRRYPRYAHAEPRAIEIEISAGDMLYLPTGWFHQVHSLPGEHIAVSFFAAAPEERQLQGMQQMLQNPQAMQQLKARYGARQTASGSA